jgi:cation diffusion facilitator CzcD-associated flavoprotein CzcO
MVLPPLPTEPSEIHDVCREWLVGFAAALSQSDSAAIAGLFHADSHWRDVLAFTWHLTTVNGAGELALAVCQAQEAVQATDFALDPNRTPPRRVTRAGTECLEAFFHFETLLGRSDGVFRLVPGPDGLTGWTFHTALQELKGFEEQVGWNRPKGESYARDFGGPNWLDQRNAALAYADRDPAVIVVGAGQGGLDIAARLGQLGVDALVVDRHERIGDNWRKRYHSLTLHNEVHVNHMPYLPFPETWPTYVPKDKLANWFEFYADAMELNVWTDTEFAGGSYDDDDARWTVTLRRGDGSERLMRPRHVIMAVGVSGIKHLPDLPGLDRFAGTVVHSTDYTDGASWEGKRALIVGTGNSGHDVAQDLHSHGAHATLVQRRPTTIVSVEPSGQLVYALYKEGPPTRDCDLIVTSVPFPLLKRTYQLIVKESRKHDRDLLEKLAAAGFRMDDGVEDTGFQMKYLERGGGYYLNVGCSELIIEGEVGLLQWDEIDCFIAEGARLKSGDVIPADLVVLATGYKGQQDLLRLLFGDETAERAGPVWGFAEDGELANMWKRTGQPGLWFIAGSLAQCRIYSKYLALQIKACEEGLISPLRDADNPTSLAAE